MRGDVVRCAAMHPASMSPAAMVTGRLATATSALASTRSIATPMRSASASSGGPKLSAHVLGPALVDRPGLATEPHHLEQQLG